MHLFAVAVLGKTLGPSSFWRQQRLSEITCTIEPIKNHGGLGKIWGPVPPGPNLEPPLPIHARRTRHCLLQLLIRVLNETDTGRHDVLLTSRAPRLITDDCQTYQYRSRSSRRRLY